MCATFILGAFALANTAGAVKDFHSVLEAQLNEYIANEVKESAPMSEVEARKRADEWNEELAKIGMKDMGICTTQAQYCRIFVGVAEPAPGSNGQWRWRGSLRPLKCSSSCQCHDKANGCYVTDLFGSNQHVWCGIPFHERPTLD